MKFKWFLILLFVVGCVGPQPKEYPPTEIPPVEDRYCLLFVVDGLGGPLAQRLIREGKLPNIKEHLYDRSMG